MPFNAATTLFVKDTFTLSGNLIGEPSSLAPVDAVVKCECMHHTCDNHADAIRKICNDCWDECYGNHSDCE